MKFVSVAVVLGMSSSLLFAAGEKAAPKAKKAEVAAVAPSSYEIDPAHSSVSFEVDHLVVSSVTGKFTKFSGQITNFDAKVIEKAQVTAKVEVASVDTAVAKRDDHLKSPDFFDAAKFPDMTLVSKSVKKKGSNGFDLIADVTMHGVTKTVVFDGTFKTNNKDLAGFVLNGKLNRQDFGMKFSKIVEGSPAVGDEVRISIRVEANKK